VRKAPLAVQAVRRIDAIFAIEREINGLAAAQRLAARQKRIMPLVDELKPWMLTERARLSRHADIAKAMDYMLKRWPAFTRFLDDGRICLRLVELEREVVQQVERKLMQTIILQAEHREIGVPVIDLEKPSARHDIDPRPLVSSPRIVEPICAEWRNIWRPKTHDLTNLTLIISAHIIWNPFPSSTGECANLGSCRRKQRRNPRRALNSLPAKRAFQSTAVAATVARHLPNWEKDAIANASSRFPFAVDANAALSSRAGEIHPINADLAREIF
jgi:hypothetical protein